jgi:twitching motility protein PilT
VADVLALLHQVVESRASDLHLKVGSRPAVRLDGRLESLGVEELTTSDLAEAVRALVPQARWVDVQEGRDVEIAHSAHGMARFRVAVYQQRGTTAMAIRHVLPGVPSFESLGLPQAIARLATEDRGLILVTGPAGSGRTTTIAAMIDRINEHERRHIVTIEDPIEFLHRDKRSIISQREVGADVDSFRAGLRRVMRLDPDVVFVGALDGVDTIQAALDAAEGGRLVLSTMDTTSVSDTIRRLVGAFPPEEQESHRRSLARVLKGVVCQRLLERTDGRGRVPATEVLVAQSRVIDVLLHPDGPLTLEQVMTDGEFYGMQTFDDSLFQLAKDGLIGVRDAVNAATRPHELRATLQALGMPIPAGELA